MNYLIDKNLPYKDSQLIKNLKKDSIPYRVDFVDTKEILFDKECEACNQLHKAPVLSLDYRVVGNIPQYQHIINNKLNQAFVIIIGLSEEEVKSLLYKYNQDYEERYGKILNQINDIRKDNEKNSFGVTNKNTTMSFDKMKNYSETPFNPDNFYKHYIGYRKTEYPNPYDIDCFFELEPDNQSFKYHIRVENPLFINNSGKNSITSLCLSFLKRRLPDSEYDIISKSGDETILRKTIDIAKNVLNYDVIIFNEKKLCLLK